MALRHLVRNSAVGKWVINNRGGTNWLQPVGQRVLVT